MTINKAKAAIKSQNFTVGRYLDTSGINSLSNSGSPNLRSFFLRCLHPTYLTTAKMGMISSR